MKKTFSNMRGKRLHSIIGKDSSPSVASCQMKKDKLSDSFAKMS